MSRRIAAAAGAAMVAVVAGGALLWTTMRAPADRFAQCRESQVAGAAQIGGPFTLIDSRGGTVTDADVLTGPSLVYFGYTFCPDVCPFDMARNGQAAQILDEAGIEATPVFITVDPARDTPQVVGDFARNFHERAVGLTGSPEQIRAAADAYRVYYQAHEDEDPEYYPVDHTAFTYLVLPEEGFVEVFRRDVTPEAMADTVECYVTAA